LETAKHLFWECKFAKESWYKYNEFSIAFNVPRLGKIYVGRVRKINKYVYAFQPWDMFRSYILWYTWVERCNAKYGTLDFSSTKVMNVIWVSIIHTGMAIKKDFNYKIKNKEKLELVRSQFVSAWSPVFIHLGLNIWYFNVPNSLI